MFAIGSNYILLSLYPPPYIGGGGYGYIYMSLSFSLSIYKGREKGKILKTSKLCGFLFNRGQDIDSQYVKLIFRGFVLSVCLAFGVQPKTANALVCIPQEIQRKPVCRPMSVL